jgi:hypothetical protein
MPESMVISPIDANLKRDTDTFGAMEVYVVIKLGDQKK